MRVRREQFQRGHVIFRQGERGQRAYFVTSGRVRIVRRDGASECTLGYVEEGELVGEMALVDNTHHSATAICETDTEVMSFSRAYLEAALKRADPLLPTLVDLLTRRYRSVMDQAARNFGSDIRACSVRRPPLAHIEHGGELCEHLEFEHDLDRALSRESELFLAAQPIVPSAGPPTPCGYELLLRWDHPTKGMIPPSRFVADAEAHGLMPNLGNWVLREAAQVARRLLGGATRFVSVNISPDQLVGSNLVDEVARACRSADIPPRAIKLEITESSLMCHPQAAEQTLTALSELGCSLAIDDFGTGYSSFSHLHRFPLDTLKIDKSFIRHVESETRAQRLVAALVNLATDLGLDVVAEGVETAAHADKLHELGCQYLQGYHFGKPQPVSAKAVSAAE